MLPQENFVKSHGRRSFLRPFLGPKSHVLQFLADRISIVSTCTLCEVVITDCAQLSACTVKPLISDPPKSGQPLYSGQITCPRLILP